MDASNWINLGILMVTAIVGILCWFGARKSAKEALDSQKTANGAAERSAAAAEKANSIQARLLELEEERNKEAEAKSKLASLRATISKGLNDHCVRISIRNIGQCKARNVHALVNGRHLDDYPQFSKKIPAGRNIGPDGEFEISFSSLTAAVISPPYTDSEALTLPFRLELSWEDDSGIRGKWESTLS